MAAADTGTLHRPTHRHRIANAPTQFHRVGRRRTFRYRAGVAPRQRHQYRRKLPLALLADTRGVAVGETCAHAAQYRIIKTTPEIPRRVIVQRHDTHGRARHAVHVQLVPTGVDAHGRRRGAQLGGRLGRAIQRRRVRAIAHGLPYRNTPATLAVTVTCLYSDHPTRRPHQTTEVLIETTVVLHSPDGVTGAHYALLIHQSYQTAHSA